MLTRISLQFVPEGPIDNKPELVQIMAWHRPGDKPLPEPMPTLFTDAYMRHEGEMCLRSLSHRDNKTAHSLIDGSFSTGLNGQGMINDGDICKNKNAREYIVEAYSVAW